MIGYAVHFYRDFLNNNITIFPVFYWCNCEFHIIIAISLCLVFHLDNNGRNHYNILITTYVRNIDWHIFNFDQLFFVFLNIRTICTYKSKRSIMYVVISERKRLCKVNRFTSLFN